ncbi:dUTP diphosphatase [Dyella telluris]|uniref:dUTP diphosphatase n=1 Tax=Dyella telluris TaxID=2763498 RepID=A0A7G8QA14_9GAMM|nr:dUTP diphosphatase [Dyella telluris]
MSTIVRDKALYADFGLPARGSDGAAAIDLRATEDIELLAGEQHMMDTGINIWIKNPGFVGLIVPRSGLGTRGLVMANGVGVIDSDYQGPLKVSLLNRSNNDIYIARGDRIAQFMLTPVVCPQLIEVENFDEATDRGNGGFGSTGAN